MNTNSNAYTIVYTSIIVILSAAILAIVSQALKPRQDANIKADTISQMMTAAQFNTEGLSNDAVISLYKGAIKESFIIDNKGGKVSEMDKGASEIFSTSKLKAQNSILKRGKADQMKLPVYVFNKDGKDITVIPVYGSGLWGPIWGYLAFEPDMKTLAGAFFNHESETPGLGAKIKDDPSFRARFVGKTVDLKAKPAFEIVKGGAGNKSNAIDAITGATMTSRGVGEAVADWLDLYKAYLTKAEE